MFSQNENESMSESRGTSTTTSPDANIDIYKFPHNYEYALYVENSHVEKRKGDLRKCLGKDAIFTGAWSDNMEEQMVSKEDLLPGEVFAVIFTIGCYSVRFAQRFYKELYKNPPVLASESEIKSASYRLGRGIYATEEVSARHINDPDGDFADGFKYICKAVSYFTSKEAIGCICAARDKNLTDEQASLFVLFAGEGGYHIPYSRWYELSPDGVVSEL